MMYAMLLTHTGVAVLATSGTILAGTMVPAKDATVLGLDY
jgi:hypothetical protein